MNGDYIFGFLFVVFGIISVCTVIGVVIIRHRRKCFKNGIRNMATKRSEFQKECAPFKNSVVSPVRVKKRDQSNEPVSHAENLGD